MVETFFKRACTIHGLRQGPLAGHIDLLADITWQPTAFLASTAESSSGSSGISTVGLSRRASVQSNSMKTSSSAIAAGSGTGSTYGLKMCAHWSGYSISCASNAPRRVARPKPFRRRGRHCLRSIDATCSTSVDLPRGQSAICCCSWTIFWWRSIRGTISILQR
jgi:hypothetical protein